MWNRGENTKIVLTDAIVAAVAYKAFGWYGPLAVLGAYLVGWLVNAYDAHRHHQESLRTIQSSFGGIRRI